MFPDLPREHLPTSPLTSLSSSPLCIGRQRAPFRQGARCPQYWADIIRVSQPRGRGCELPLCSTTSRKCQTPARAGTDLDGTGWPPEPPGWLTWFALVVSVTSQGQDHTSYTIEFYGPTRMLWGDFIVSLFSIIKVKCGLCRKFGQCNLF